MSKPILQPSTHTLAMRTIAAMTQIDTQGYICVVYLSCHLSCHRIKAIAKTYDYHIMRLYSVAKYAPLWIKLLLIPKANVAIIHPKDLKHLDDFFYGV